MYARERARSFTNWLGMEIQVCSNIFTRNITVTPPSGKTAYYACDNVRLVIRPAFCVRRLIQYLCAIGEQNKSWASLSVANERYNPNPWVTSDVSWRKPGRTCMYVA